MDIHGYSSHHHYCYKFPFSRSLFASFQCLLWFVFSLLLGSSDWVLFFNSLGVRDFDHTHSFAMVRALRPVNAAPDWLNTVPEIKPLTKPKEWFLSPFMLNKRNSPAGTFLQPAKTATMCMVLVPKPVLLPLFHLFFSLAQNLSLNQIAPPDNIQPKLYDKYTHYQ